MKLIRVAGIISLLVAISGSVLLHAPVATAAVHSATVVRSDVVGDNANDSYIGTGGLLLPSSFSGNGSTKRKVASCMGCVWKYSVYCAADSTDMCAHAVNTCPPQQIRYRVWFGQTRDTVSVVGSLCWGYHTPATRRQIEDRLDDLVIRHVPTAHIDCDPPGDTLTTIPVVCFSTQPAVYRPAPFQLATHTVRITATPKWRWVWGDGTSQWRSTPGKPYPSRVITHTYRSEGHFTVETTTVWGANYNVSGLGTFQVGGDVITQSASLGLTVHSVKSLRTLSR